jgi:hypothetical protein
MTMRTSQLQPLLERIDAVTTAAKDEFCALSATQVNWKPHPESWSIGQCLDHLITVNSSYFPMLEEIAQNKRRPTLWERMPLLPRLFGSVMKNAVSPEAERKYKTFSNFVPTQSAIPPLIVHDFAQHQGELKAMMQSVEGLDRDSIIVTSPASPVVIYSLADCFEILTNHEERHLNQARHVAERPEFPKV